MRANSVPADSDKENDPVVQILASQGRSFSNQAGERSKGGSTEPENRLVVLLLLHPTSHHLWIMVAFFLIVAHRGGIDVLELN